MGPSISIGSPIGELLNWVIDMEDRRSSPNRGPCLSAQNEEVSDRDPPRGPSQFAEVGFEVF